MIQKSILQKILAILARATIRKYKPKIIGITGSVGKTSTREAVFAVLSKKYRVRQAEKNYNNEIGFPLAILGIPHCGRNIFGWLYGLIRANRRIVWRSPYPEALVLEYGMDRPGDMDYLLSIAKPDIAVVTAIGDIPVHVEFFKDIEELIMEKAKLVVALPAGGLAVLNHDDFAVYGMKDKTKARVITFGTEEHSDIKTTNYKLQIIKDNQGNDIPDGVSFKIEYQGNMMPARFKNTFGMPQVYSAAAAAAVGIALGLNLVEISEALASFNPISGRLRLLDGIKNSWILDDTYNAAPESMRLALDTLRVLPGKRKIAVLGDMLEIGKYSEQAHRAVGDQAAKFVDLLFCVGPRAKFIADAAQQSGRASPHEMGREAGHALLQIFKFGDSESAGKTLDPMIREGDLILVKGSQSMRMEKVVEEIMAHPEKAGELLVRQDKNWKRK
ncbi:MAG: UDP-N-acetylmuramoyl-tripeptide--D-alanyl-D-alanine ligase [Candidatus Sungbacteria bacterium]|nr:UDP-N-acetylmuramoyl-tripeptide--D-alanyl-D-alanine ligase [Candidatus Sungbacteria bacterium]